MFFYYLQYTMFDFRKMFVHFSIFHHERMSQLKVLAISGYKAFEMGIFRKDHPAAGYIKNTIKRELISKLAEGFEWVLISGQLGIELWAAETVFELQSEYPELKLAVITPFLDQEANWSEHNKEWYQSVLAGADYLDSVTKKPYEKPWQFRLKNQFFIEKSNALLIVYDPEKEGSPKYLYDMALQYQRNHEYPVHLITFLDLQAAIEEDEYNHNDF